MTKFIVLYSSPVKVEDQMQQSTEANEAEIKKWMDWSVAAGTALVDFGMPLGNGKTVSPGGVSESDMPVTGYSIVEVKDMDAAAALFTSHPHLANGTIDIHEAYPIPGM